MFHRGKRRLLAALTAALGLSWGGGCQVSLGPVTPSATGGTNATSPYLGGGAPSSNTGSSYMPTNIQQTSYGDDAKGPPAGPPPGPPGMPGPGCPPGGPMGPDPGPIPREINKVSLPPYTVAPPDILIIDAARLVPRGPYRVEPLEVLQITVSGTLPNQPIAGTFIVSPEGTINLGYGYGTIRVLGLTVDQIREAIRVHLSSVINNPQVSVSLAQFRGQMQVRGEHLVRPDGTISLGSYGCIYVAGMTLGQIKCVIEKHLSQYVVNPQVAVDVFAYNSQWYYVIFDGAGYGEQVYRLPITGNETVLDAISNLQGLPPQASLRRIWVARPAPCGHPCDQVLLVDWRAITQGGSTCTNYQLFPGDRVFVDSDCLIKTDSWIAKILSPIERVLGVTLLAAEIRNTWRNNNNNSGIAFVAPIR